LPVHDRTLWATGRAREKTSAEQKATAAHIKQQREKIDKQIEEEKRRLAATQARFDEYNEIYKALEATPPIHLEIDDQLTLGGMSAD